MFVSEYNVYLDSLDTIVIELNTPSEIKSVKLETENEVNAIEFAKIADNKYEVKLLSPLNLQVKNYVHINNKRKLLVIYRDVVRTDAFDQKYQTNEQLGSIINKELNTTTFKLWAPTASSVVLKLQKKQSAQIEYIDLKANGRTYECTVNEVVDEARYTYLVETNGIIQETVDPYAMSSTLNSEQSYVIDKEKLLAATVNIEKIAKPIIYETSVRDFTSAENQKFKLKGKYLGFAENGVKNQNGDAIGIDYVKSLGITHIQLMPFYDFGSIDEQMAGENENYNWGYDPVQYNIPEGSFLVNTDAYSRINEPIQMIKAIKENGMRVVMDIVYNHVYTTSNFSFEKIIPGYYFRYDQNRQLSDGTYCGNEVCSERLMVRKYIIDTCVNWVQTYGIDGFRVDLMGIMDCDTINELAAICQKINPSFIIYGEGWNMDCGLPSEKRATQVNAQKLPTIGFFNDDFRDFIKGHNSEYEKLGYVQGNKDEELLAMCLAGQAIDPAKANLKPEQMINYLSCHDDHTLYDRLKMNTSSEDEITKQIKLALELLFKAKGIPFLHSGCEFKRTKNGLKNTYNNTASINSIDWDLISENQEIIEHLKKHTIIHKNNTHKAFSPQI